MIGTVLALDILISMSLPSMTSLMIGVNAISLSSCVTALELAGIILLSLWRVRECAREDANANENENGLGFGDEHFPG